MIVSDLALLSGDCICHIKEGYELAHSSLAAVAHVGFIMKLLAYNPVAALKSMATFAKSLPEQFV